MADSGGTTPTERQSILSNNGVPSSLQTQNMENIERAVAEGRGVITSHNAGKLWGTTDSGGHAVLVTGIEYDENGNPTRVFFNDTGTGHCMNSVPASQFQNSLRPGRQINVTNDPIW
jgi:phosphoribosyl-AMP cyclohydrolase